MDKTFKNALEDNFGYSSAPKSFWLVFAIALLNSVYVLITYHQKLLFHGCAERIMNNAMVIAYDIFINVFTAAILIVFVVSIGTNFLANGRKLIEMIKAHREGKSDSADEPIHNRHQLFDDKITEILLKYKKLHPSVDCDCLPSNLPKVLIMASTGFYSLYIFFTFLYSIGLLFIFSSNIICPVTTSNWVLFIVSNVIISSIFTFAAGYLFKRFIAKKEIFFHNIVLNFLKKFNGNNINIRTVAQISLFFPRRFPNLDISRIEQEIESKEFNPINLINEFKKYWKDLDFNYWWHINKCSLGYYHIKCEAFELSIKISGNRIYGIDFEKDCYIIVNRNASRDLINILERYEYTMGVDRGKLVTYELFEKEFIEFIREITSHYTIDLDNNKCEPIYD